MPRSLSDTGRLVFVVVCGYILGSALILWGLAQLNKTTEVAAVAGPFRPRPPKPPTPPAPTPEPQPKDDQERVLFERIRVWVEARAEARAEAKVAELMDEVGANLDAFSFDQVDLPQGALGAILAAKIAQLVKKVVSFLILAAVSTALIALLTKYWMWVFPAFTFAVSLIAWPAGYTAGKSSAK